MPQQPPADIDEWARRLSDAFAQAAASMANETELREHVHPVVTGAMAELYGMQFTASSAERGPARGSRLRYDRLYGGVAVEMTSRVPARRP